MGKKIIKVNCLYLFWKKKRDEKLIFILSYEQIKIQQKEFGKFLNVGQKSFINFRVTKRTNMNPFEKKIS